MNPFVGVTKGCEGEGGEDTGALFPRLSREGDLMSRESVWMRARKKEREKKRENFETKATTLSCRGKATPLCNMKRAHIPYMAQSDTVAFYSVCCVCVYIGERVCVCLCVCVRACDGEPLSLSLPEDEPLANLAESWETR